jgi:hypothetical protein
VLFISNGGWVAGAKGSAIEIGERLRRGCNVVAGSRCKVGRRVLDCEGAGVMGGSLRGAATLIRLEIQDSSQISRIQMSFTT